jgi:hypothetical protein
MRNTVISIVIIGTFHLVTSCKIEANLFPVDNSKIGVQFNKTRGTIFKNNYPFRNFNVSDIDSTFRWTPDKKDIELAEKILRQNISEMNKNSPNQFGSCPIIHRNLNKYFRQYVGIENIKGQKVIHINFYWDRYSSLDRVKGYSDSRLSFKSDYAIVFDGCSYYWQINVNLDEKSLSDFRVNGVA